MSEVWCVLWMGVSENFKTKSQNMFYFKRYPARNKDWDSINFETNLWWHSIQLTSTCRDSVRYKIKGKVRFKFDQEWYSWKWLYRLWLPWKVGILEVGWTWLIVWLLLLETEMMINNWGSYLHFGKWATDFYYPIMPLVSSKCNNKQKQYLHVIQH